MKLTIVIPVFNEQESLPGFLHQLEDFCTEHQFSVILVNDASTDSTGEILKSFQREEFSIITHKVNRGYGGALKTGIRAANSQYVITMDADGQHRLSDVLHLYNEICDSRADMIIGSRRSQHPRSRFRSIGKYFIRNFTRIYMKVEVQDINSGMKIYNSSIVQKLIRFAPDGMAFSDVITLVFINLKYYIKEIEIQTLPRTGGRSTINYKTAFNTIKEITLIATTFFPLKFFSSIASVVLLISVIWGIPFVLEGKGITTGTAAGLLFSFLFFILGIITEMVALIRKDLILNGDTSIPTIKNHE